jgi:cell division GTPase FtsZ
MTQKIVAEKTRAMKIGVVGSGQAGSRLAETFYKLGYPAVCINTASQDLKHILLSDDHKLLLEYGLGGASKDREIGKAATDQYRSEIYELVHQKLVSPPTLRDEDKAVDFLLFTTSLGGGSGSGSVEPMLDILSGFAPTPIMVMAVLPMSNEDYQTKQNAIQTLSVLAKHLQDKKIHNLIVVDNAKIEAAYAQVSQLDFYQTSNTVIVEPLDAFNFYASQPSQVKSMDPMEFAKIMVDGEEILVFIHLVKI